MLIQSTIAYIWSTRIYPQSITYNQVLSLDLLTFFITSLTPEEQEVAQGKQWDLRQIEISPPSPPTPKQQKIKAPNKAKTDLMAYLVSYFPLAIAKTVGYELQEAVPFTFLGTQRLIANIEHKPLTGIKLT